MKLTLTEISKSLNKAYLKQDLTREQMETFKTNLRVLFSKSEIAEAKKEHEEHYKNIVSEFLKDTYYKNNFEININKRKDLVIHNSKSPADSVGVIIEAKKPSNEMEMISSKMPNSKALHELILYYFEEREANKNIEVKHLVANNVYDWFIFDENEFDKLFYRNNLLQKLYQAKISQSKDNPFFYSEAAKIIDGLDIEVQCTYFNFKDYEKAAFNSDNADDTELINLYKILSPEHLLKKPFANDSNTLNKAFYNELLHIIGLEERPDGGKKLITRKKAENRDDASLLENTINKLKVDNCLGNFDKPEQFGDTPEEQIYSLGLELCITWLNRILFLKLLEGQLVNYHNGNKDFSFMNIHSIADFDELNELFFEVLAEEYHNRSKTVNNKFGNIPYLNSSLFDKSEIEKKTFSISNLKDRLELALYPQSILFKKDANKQTTKIITLHYLIEFLSAYNFSSDSSAKIQDDNKNMINASVLGLIFEKINGYKDGSFFTPGFITMYMCRETIRKAVAQKFKELENKEIDNFEDVKNYTARYFKKEDIARFNKHINSLKICDPAVGSGHFLVSALNEIIAIKSDLNILVDREGTPLEYEITVDNDELTILNKKTNKPFEYLLGTDNKPPKALQQVQVSLFQEKQKIIENCLFGVDINPKSVLICRLRLWIELLKNAYYKFPIVETHGRASLQQLELETLPNIDINIKCGNSLISRFPINSNLKQLARTSKWTIFSYQNAVQSYKKSTDKNVKRDLEKLIKDIKSNYVNVIQQKNPILQKYYKLKQEYDYKFPENGLFAHEPEKEYGNNKKKREDEKNRLANELKKAHEELEAEKTFFENNNAFEWRFEFPEVLNDDGDFVGFDVVIGNPPYYSLSKIKHQADYFEKTGYQTYSKGTDIYCLFYEKGNQILNSFGLLTFITSNSWMRAIYGNLLKKFITQNMQPVSLLNIEDIQIFEEATVESNIIILQKNKDNSPFFVSSLSKDYIIGKSLSSYFKSNNFEFKIPETTEWIIGNEETGLLKLKIEKNSKLLKEFDIQINFGIKTGYNAAFIIDEETKNKIINEDPKSSKIIKPIVRGRDLKKYSYEFENCYLINTHNGLKQKDIKRVDVVKKYPAIYDHLKKYLPNVEDRYDKGDHWSNLRNCAYLEDFEKPKIIWGEISDKPKFAYDDSNIYAEATTFFMTGEKLKYLLAILNSNVSEWYFNNIGTTTGMGTNRWKKYKIEMLPIKVPTENMELKIINLVDKIIYQKEQNLDTSELENQIDQLIYQVYNLTPVEIAIVEGN